MWVLHVDYKIKWFRRNVIIKVTIEIDGFKFSLVILKLNLT